MFREASTSELRQGDICFEWHYPKWQLQDYQVVTNALDATVGVFLQVHAKGAKMPLAVCSHDCEIENPRSRLGVLVAPVLPFTDALSDDERMDIVQSSRPLDNKYAHINLFPVQLPQEGSAPQWNVIDFSAITHVSRAHKAVPVLLAAKRLEMTDNARTQFKEKLAAFFGRP